ncbi:MAG: flippase [Gordonibacter pamelaeae]
MRNSFFNMLYQLVLLLVPLASAMYVSRVVMPEGLGEIATAENLVSYFTALAPLGIPAYGLREVAKVRGNLRARSKIFSELVLLNFVSTFLFLGVYATCVLAFFDGAVPALYLIFGSLIVANCLNVEWLFTGLERYVFISVRGMVVRIASLILTLVFVKGPDDVLIYAGITCLATVANYLVNVVCLHGQVKFALRGITPFRHLKPVLVLAGTIVLFSIYTKVDITMLGVFCTSSVVAYYAYKAEEIAKMLCVSLTSVYLPRLSYQFIHDRKEFSRLVRQSMMLNIWISAPMTMGVFMLAPHIVPLLFGEAFLPAVLTLQMFSGLIVAKSIGQIIYQVTIATGNERFQLVAYSVGVAVNIALNFALIPMLAKRRRCGYGVNRDRARCRACVLHQGAYALDYAASILAFPVRWLGRDRGGSALVRVSISDHLLCTGVSVVLSAITYGAIGIACKNEMAVLLLRRIFRR